MFDFQRDQRQQQVALGFEVVLERADRYLGQGGDIFGADGGIGHFAEKLHRRPQQTLVAMRFLAFA
jgi:hypothetical protein